MVKKARSNRKQTGLSTAILSGFGIAVAVLLLGAIAVSFAVVQGTLGENTISYITPVILFIAVLAGSYASGRWANNDIILACMGVAGAVLFVLMAITILLFEGRFQSVITGISGVVLGCAGAFALNLRQPKPKYRKRR